MRRESARRRAIEARLGRETEIWIATVRADGRPHLVPVWFVWLNGHIYICTGTDTQKWANLHGNQRVALSLPDPIEVVIIEGEAHAVGHQLTNELADYFFHKYEWDFRVDDSRSWRLVEITPLKLLAWGDANEHEGTHISL